MRNGTEQLLNWKKVHPEKARMLGKVTGQKNAGTTFIATGKIAVGENNIHAKQWSISSPQNVTYQFKNLAEFVRGNSELFEAKDLIRKTRTGDTNAEKQLSKLNPNRTFPRLSWKGWTWAQIKPAA